MNAVTLGPCLIEHCANRRRPRSPVCAACAQNFSYWDKRGPDAIVTRQRTLEKWQDRMQYMGENYTDKAKVKHVARSIEKRRSAS
jgi:hypothetical protein